MVSLAYLTSLLRTRYLLLYVKKIHEIRLYRNRFLTEFSTFFVDFITSQPVCDAICYPPSISKLLDDKYTSSILLLIDLQIDCLHFSWETYNFMCLLPVRQVLTFPAEHTITLLCLENSQWTSTVMKLDARIQLVRLMHTHGGLWGMAQTLTVSISRRTKYTNKWLLSLCLIILYGLLNDHHI